MFDVFFYNRSLIFMKKKYCLRNLPKSERKEKENVSIKFVDIFVRIGLISTRGEREKKISFTKKRITTIARRNFKVTFSQSRKKDRTMFYDRENLELLSIVWLDKFGDATQENREIEEKLRSIVNYVRIFDNCQSCTNYLTNEINDYDKIIFIVSGQLGQEILDHIHHLTQIISILIFCGNKPKYQLWAQNYQKVFCVIH